MFGFHGIKGFVVSVWILQIYKGLNEVQMKNEENAT